MISPAVIDAFRARQRQLLADVYDEAWLTGVDNYEPDPDPAHPLQEDDQGTGPSDKAKGLLALAAFGGVASVLANRLRKYRKPSEPDPVKRDRALAAAYRGVDRMGGELAHIAPNADQLAAAQAALSGSAQFDEVYRQATVDAAQQWADRNQWRLNLGESVAWAGEQDGYAAAASADGMLLEWQTEADDKVCPECDALGGMPPMTELDWPTTPGAGGTTCEANCRCSLDAFDPAPGDILNVDDLSSLFPLSDEQQQSLADVTSKVADRLLA